jgi:hypothetical protein
VDVSFGSQADSLYSPSGAFKPLSDVCASRLIPNFKAVDSDWFFHVLVWAPCVQVRMPRNAQNRLSHKSLKLGNAGGGLYFPTSDFQLILFDGAVKGLTAAFYSVLEVSIPLRKLSNDFVWTRRSLPRWIALGEVHHVPGKEAVLRRVLFGQAHCEAFSRVAAEGRR